MRIAYGCILGAVGFLACSVHCYEKQCIERGKPFAIKIKASAYSYDMRLSGAYAGMAQVCHVWLSETDMQEVLAVLHSYSNENIKLNRVLKKIKKGVVTHTVISELKNQMNARTIADALKILQPITESIQQ